MGYSCVLLGREAEAVSWIDRSLELKPDNAAATSLRASLLKRLGGGA